MKAVNKFVLIAFATLFTFSQAQAMRWYSSSTGHWLSRDPAEEDGGPNLFNFCGNDAIDFYDILGLSWGVQRKGGHRAHAKPQSGDTVSDLAKLIGFDDTDYTKWLKPLGPTPMPASASTPITQCSEFTIPNTIYIEFGQQYRTLDGWGPIPAWQSSLTSMGRSYIGKGFNVVTRNPSDPGTAQADLQDQNIFGFAYAGHGGGNADNGRPGFTIIFSGGEGATALDANRYTPFGINFFFAYACSTATRDPNSAQLQMRLGYKYSPWEKNAAIHGIFKGIWGEVNGYQAWSHVVETPGTNSK